MLYFATPASAASVAANEVEADSGTA